MTCGHCVGAGKVFSDRRARKELSRFRKKGPSKSTRQLVDALEAEGVRGSSVIDIGAGVGAVHLSLLEVGAADAVHVDAAPAYQTASREEAERRGLSEQITYVSGDYLDVADDLPAADVVCLDRVICCYPDMKGLVTRSVAAAERAYGLVFPVNRAWVRLAIGLANTGLALLRNPFRTFVHPEDQVRRAVEDAGFTLVFEGRSGMWRTLVYSRPPVSHERPSARSSG